MIAAIGEILLRFNTAGYKRFNQSFSYELNIGGAEVNVIAALSQWGHKTRMISAVPTHEMGELVIQEIRKLGVDISLIQKREGRMGMYFLEKGIGDRGGKVIYDRKNSVFANATTVDWNWTETLKNCSWLHWSGITPAISHTSAEVLESAIGQARAKKIPISVDLNFRANLWQWGKSPEEVCPGLVEKADVLIANEEATQRMLGIDVAPNEEGLTVGYKEMSQKIFSKFPDLKHVFIPIRRTVNASVNRINLFHAGKQNHILGEWFEVTNIVDRIGSGDAMTAAIIHGLIAEMKISEICSQAKAASAFKHSIPGDVLIASWDEINALAFGGKAKIAR